jgi:hypothetical protein
MDPNTPFQTGSCQKSGGRSVNQIRPIDRQIFPVAGQLNTHIGHLKHELIVKGYRQEEGLKIMKTIRSPTKDVEDEVDLATGQTGEGHGGNENAPN